MAKKYSNGVAVATGFKVSGATPIDDRMLVETAANLLDESSIISTDLYPYIEVVAADTGKKYKWNGSDRTLAINWPESHTPEVVGFTTVLSLAERDSIPLANRSTRHIVNVLDTGTFAYYGASTADINWQNAVNWGVVGASFRGSLDGNRSLSYSDFGMGFDNISSGYLSFAHGESNEATGYGSWTMGYLAKSSGQFSVAWGFDVDVVGDAVHALGSYITQVAGTQTGISDFIHGWDIGLTSTEYSFAFGRNLDVEGLFNAVHVVAHTAGTVGSGIPFPVNGNANKAFTHTSAAYSGTGILGNYNGMLGGYDNSIIGSYCVSLGGQQNEIDTGSLGVAVLSGITHYAAGTYSSIVGGNTHFIDGVNNAILGGDTTYIDATCLNSAVLGGLNNGIYAGHENAILGGDGNSINANWAAIIGGDGNTVNVAAVRSVILGGIGITATKPDMAYIAKLTATAIPAYQDDAAAGVGGLLIGEVYQTSGTGAGALYGQAGVLMIKQ